MLDLKAYPQTEIGHMSLQGQLKSVYETSTFGIIPECPQATFEY